MKELDYNKDGKLSFDEFADWWKCGRRGVSPALRRMIQFKMKASNLLSKASSAIKSMEEKKTSELAKEVAK